VLSAVSHVEPHVSICIHAAVRVCCGYRDLYGALQLPINGRATRRWLLAESWGRNRRGSALQTCEREGALPFVGVCLLVTRWWVLLQTARGSSTEALWVLIIVFAGPGRKADLLWTTLHNQCPRDLNE